jgi:glycosyltransferase involved in cell wall biosynthesis
LGCLGADLFRDGAVCTACVGRSPWRGVVHACYRGSRLQSAVQAAEVVVTRRRNVLDRCVRRFVAPSQFMADRLVELGLPRDRLHVKAHFVADPGPRPSPPSSSSRVLSVGRLAPGKGLDTLVDAWNRLDGSDGRTLTIVGDGPLAPSLGHAAGVERPGWLPRHEVIERLLTARALVMPSEWYEPFGMVLVEAMSAGLPIVVTTAAGARAIVGPDGAVAVPPRDAAALAGAIESLDDDTVDRLGAANRRRYDARYTESAGLAALEELYRSVLPGAQV